MRMVASSRAIDLQRTLAHVNVPSFVSNRKGGISWANAAAETAFGNVIGKSFEAIAPPSSAALMRRQLERKLRGAPATDYEIDVVTTDGVLRRVEISSVAIQGGDECNAVFGVALPGAPRPGVAQAELTQRQTQVLQLLGDGASTADIAAMLHLSRETVRNHVRHFLRALGTHSRLEAVAVAHQRGLLQ